MSDGRADPADAVMAARGSHYAALEVAPTATQREIRAAYRRLARQTHPDGHAGDAALERRFKRIARAYEVLGDPARRRAYDDRASWGRFARPGSDGPATFAVDSGPVYHSDFYQAGDPLTTTEAAALIRRDAGWLRRAIRTGRLSASRGPGGYLLRRRDVERLDRVARRRSRTPIIVDDADEASEGMDTI